MSNKFHARHESGRTIVLSPREGYTQIPWETYFGRVQAMHNEAELKRRASAAFVLAGTAAQTELLHFAVVLPPSSDPPTSVLYRSLARLDRHQKPEELLQDLMQHDLVRPTFESERKARTYSRFADLTKESFLRDTDTWRRLDITARTLKDLQTRLESARIGSELAILDCAFADLKNGRSSVIYVHLTLNARPTTETWKHTHSPVELEAVWEKRTFPIRTNVSMSDLYSEPTYEVNDHRSMNPYLSVDEEVIPESRSFNASVEDEDLPPPYEHIDSNPAFLCRGQMGPGILDA